MQSWRKRAGGDPHTKPLVFRAEGKRIFFHVQAITKQGNTVAFCDRGILQLPLQENRTKPLFY